MEVTAHDYQKENPVRSIPKINNTSQYKSVGKELTKDIKEELKTKPENRLAELISTIREGIANESSIIDKIKNPKKLLNALEELNGMIGNKVVKDSIADQTQYLISKLNNDQKNVDMLGTILYGPPGIGKTTMGCILAKIWDSLGYIDNTKKDNDVLSGPYDGGNVKDVIGSGYTFIIFYFIVLTIYMLYVLGQSLYSAAGLYGFLAVLLFIMIGLFYIFYGSISGMFGGDTTNNININIDGQNNTNDDIMKIVSREDFIGLYVGSTDKKTRKLLEDNRGKVLFITEAYSLCNGPFDQYGMEALTTLNRFLSENPGAIIPIMDGYEDKLKSNILDSQPGLTRRFMWHFKCQQYTIPELAQIFRIQLRRKKLDIDFPEELLIELFEQNKKVFPSFAGDTEKLVFFTEIEKSKDDIKSNKDNKIVGQVTYEQVTKAIRILEQNNIQKDTDTEKPKRALSDILGDLM